MVIAVHSVQTHKLKMIHLIVLGFRFVQTSTLQETRVVSRVQAVFDALKEALAVVFVIVALQ